MRNLRIFSTELDIEWSLQKPLTAIAPVALASAELPTLRQRVRAMHAMHPMWTARLIANELGAPFASVSTYLAEARRQTKAVA